MQVANGVYRLGTAHVNFYVIDEGGRLTVVDAGMPGYWRGLRAGLSAMGRSVADVEAVVLTHAHVDHVGFAEQVRRDGATVHVEERDAGTKVRKFPPLHLYWRPTSWPFLLEGLRNGLLKTPPVTAFNTFTDGDVLDVPGAPRAIATPGHTSGSCALHLPLRGVLMTGDAMVTFDPYTQGKGPRLLLPQVNENHEQARASLTRLADVDAEILLPGHGDPWKGNPATAVEQALAAS
jgi:glyoxylase-like metal-dependent hydrolase (beta-lactamase superfamily II)